MTKYNVKQFLPLVQAWAEGKTLQFNTNGQWNDTEHVEFCLEPKRYRIKPTPTIRAWRPEEVPLGAQFRVNSWHEQERATISHVTPTAFYTSGGRHSQFSFGFGEALKDSSYSIDGGKTWLPCGCLAVD